MNFSPFPELKTGRLILRQLNESDDNILYSLRSDSEVNRFLDRPPADNVQEVRQFIRKILDGIQRNEWIYWAIRLKNSPELIGTVCLWNFSDDGKTAETGYELLPSFSGYGYMNETLKAVIRFAFRTLSLHRIEAWTHRENYRSTRLLLNNGFILDVDRRDMDHEDQVIYILNRYNPG
jgi:ribosomal-protein-alanine N-acetyltransferase